MASHIASLASIQPLLLSLNFFSIASTISRPLLFLYPSSTVNSKTVKIIYSIIEESKQCEQLCNDEEVICTYTNFL
jgi:hypothetical protein